MLLRMSMLLLRTLREDPAEAEASSHRLLRRAGYLQSSGSGGYTWLPLGQLVLDRLTRLVREELTSLGDQEVRFPTLLQVEPHSAGGLRDEESFTLTDRRGVDHLLAPGHEELAALLVRDLVTSYRNLPVALFGIQDTFRDMARPRAGLLRDRECLTAETYSFDLEGVGLEEAYERHRTAYQRIFERLGLDVTLVTGVSHGSHSQRFVATTTAGEDSFFGCTSCDFAAQNTAISTPAPPPADPQAHPAAQVYDTPDTATIASLVEFANVRRLAGRDDWTAADTLKNVVLMLHRPGVAEPELLVIGVPGDREVDLTRVASAFYPATVRVLEDFTDQPDLVRGYIGPQVLAKLGVRYLVDPRVAPGTSWLTGANEPGRHAVNVVCGREFVPDGTIEAADVRVGDPCPACGVGQLTARRGVEVAHLVRLGRRLTDSYAVDVLGPAGKPVRPAMGCYVLALSRLVAAVIEQHHDERGLIWSAALAPCDVHLVAAGKGPQYDAALTLGEQFADAGLRVLVDDRTHVSAGVKFTDAELIGIPNVVVVGRRLAEGYVELRNRSTGMRDEVPMEQVLLRLMGAATSQ